MSWRDEVLDPVTMSDDEIRAELRHDLNVYDDVQHPLSKQAMAARIDRLVREADSRPSMQQALDALEGRTS